MSDREIELKLLIKPEDLPRLREASVLGKAKGRPITRQLESVYFDTPDLRLYGRALTLRVRRQGRRYIQTLKSAPESNTGVCVRGEWEAPVSDASPNLAALPDPELRARLGPLTEADLRPVFASHIKRTIRTLAPSDGVEIEVAVDQGEIRTAEGQILAVTEIELELKQGEDTGALYQVALALNEVVPLRVDIRSKAQRGYALATGAATEWVKAGKLELGAEDSVETALARIVRHCLEHLVANEACALAGDNPEGIHQMRVALRRLRSALGMFRHLIPAAQYSDLVAEVKWLAGSFGAARDWDVFLEEIHAPVAAALHDEPSLEALAQAGRRCRVLGYEAARAAILSPRYTALLLRLGAWIDGKAWRQQFVSEGSARLFGPVSALAGQLLAKRHRQARQRGRRFAEQSPELRHELRIGLKKLRYAADFFRTLYPPKAVKRYVDDLAELQDALGHLQDVATIAKLVLAVDAELGDGAPAGWQHGAGIVLGWHARGLQDLEPRLVRDWQAFSEAKPFWLTPEPAA